jgi:nickel-dependent lactate racemase
MMQQKFLLDFGEKKVPFAVNQADILDIIAGQSCQAITDVPQAIRQALQAPIGSPLLSAIVQPGDHVVVIVSDITRQWIRYDLILPTLIDELNDAGIPDEAITLLVALGAHRPQTDLESLETYGQEIMNRLAIKQSYALRDDDFAVVGQTTRGITVRLNKEAAQADKVILTGGIVYHSMAGFGGGRKAILPGIAAYSTIQGNHQLCLHEIAGKGLNPHCDAGNLDDNEMNQDMLEMAQLLNPAFLFNAVYTPDGNFARFVAGHWQEAWLEGCQTVKELYGVSIHEQADLVIASAGGFPKDINFYQASKTIENAYLAVKAGGVLIALMECRDINDPPDFGQWFEYESLTEREAALRDAFTVPGFVALKLGLIAQLLTVIVVTLPENRRFIEQAGMVAAGTLAEAVTLGRNLVGSEQATITIMAQGATTLPILR